jgi:FkbM family methyltransferase
MQYNPIHIYNKIKKVIDNHKNKIKIIFKYLHKFKCHHKWYGNDYGGFYICLDMLPSPEKYISRTHNRDIVIYSCGVGEDISFDIDMMRDFDCKIFAFDPTPKSIEWIKQQNLSDKFIFFPYGINDKTEIQNLHLSNTSLDISASIYVHSYTADTESIPVQMKSLKDIAAENNHTYIDILKMDIEGSEFAVLNNLPDDIVFGQIVVEFHERFLDNGDKILKNTINNLKKHGYHCFAISKHGDEYSFINKNEYQKMQKYEKN